LNKLNASWGVIAVTQPFSMAADNAFSEVNLSSAREPAAIVPLPGRAERFGETIMLAQKLGLKCFCGERRGLNRAKKN